VMQTWAESFHALCEQADVCHFWRKGFRVNFYDLHCLQYRGATAADYS
jgi:hypothetical protein